MNLPLPQRTVLPAPSVPCGQDAPSQDGQVPKGAARAADLTSPRKRSNLDTGSTQKSDKTLPDGGHSNTVLQGINFVNSPFI